MTYQATVQVLDENGKHRELTLELIDEFRGRSSRVCKVRDVCSGETIIEKIYKPKWFSRLAYLLFLQSNYPYESKEDAVLTSFYGTKILALLTKFQYGHSLVADAKYVRWDPENRAFVLGKEFIEGRGPRPSSQSEMNELIKEMEERKKFLYEVGFIGAVWQSEPGWGNFGVGTSNFLLTNENKWVQIDTESAVPAFTRYGLKSGNFPLFDDMILKN